MLRLLSLAAAARQLGVCPATAKKILSQIPDVRVEANGRTMFRQDALTAYVQSGGKPAVKTHANN
jgi:hypothetical protein